MNGRRMVVTTVAVASLAAGASAAASVPSCAPGTAPVGVATGRAGARPGDPVADRPRRRGRPARLFLGLIGIGNGWSCPTVTAGRHTIVDRVEWLASLDLCVAGLARTPAPTFLLVSPSGALRRAGSGSHTGDGTWTWRLVPQFGAGPLTELGSYYFSIVGVDPAGRPAVTSGRITVTPATDRGMTLTGDLRPGGHLVINVAGYPAGSQVAISLYGPRVRHGDRAVYHRLRDLPDLTVGTGGTGLARWRLPRTIPIGGYALWLDPAPAGGPDCGPARCQTFTVDKTEEHR